MQDFWTNLEKEVVAMLQAIATEFRSRPPYLIDAERIPTQQKYGLAYTSQNLDLLVKPFMLHWSGRAPAIVYCRVAIAEKTGNDPGEMRRLFLGAIVHESAHVLAENFFVGYDKPEPPAYVSEFQKLIFLAPPSPIEKKADVLREEERADFFHHGPRFLRAALHLRYRAATMCEMDLLVSDVCGRYLPIHPSVFANALAGEPEEWIGQPITAIIDKIAPRNVFSETWEQAKRIFFGSVQR